MSLLNDVGNLLESRSVAKLGNNLFLGTRPEEPEEVLVIHEYPGLAPQYQNDGHQGPVRELPQLQVMGRGRDYESVRKLVQDAWDVLAGVTNQTLGSTRYLSIRPNSSPSLVGRDQSDRVLIGFNAAVVKELG